MTVHLTHWGTFEAVSDGERLTGVRPWRGDPEPTPLIGNVASAQHHPARISQPHVRKGWLDHGPGAPGRGDEPFVPVSWDTALDLLSGELRRVYRDHGAEAVYGGSYGWSSAGRFHHAQSQVHRFLNMIGGYVRHNDSYSLGAGRGVMPHVIMPHVFMPMEAGWDVANSFDVMAQHTRLFVAFGGVPAKNAQISSGGAAIHHLRDGLRGMANAGTRFVNISPVADNLDTGRPGDWIPIRPNNDTALMLALAHVLVRDGKIDRDFLARCCHGYDR